MRRDALGEVAGIVPNERRFRMQSACTTGELELWGDIVGQLSEKGILLLILMSAVPAR